MSGSNLNGSHVFGDYSRWTVLQLKIRLRELQLRFTSKDRKAQLIAILTNYDQQNNTNNDEEPDNDEESDNDEEEEPDQVDENDALAQFVRHMQAQGKSEEEIVEYLESIAG